MVLVANCGEVIPPFVRLRSGITPDDGMLDVIVLKASNVPESVRAIWHLLTERAEGEFIRYGRGQEVRVVTEPIEPVQLDGEPGGVTPFTATIVPGAIRVMVPG